MSENHQLTYFINTLDWGGAQTGMARLLSGLDKQIFDIKIVCFRIDDKEFLTQLPDHVDIVELNVKYKYQIASLAPLIRIFSNTDILICSMYHSSLVGTVLGKVMRIPVIFRWQHSTKIQNCIRQPVHRLTASLATKVLADCEESGFMLEEELGISEDDIEVLTLAGINPDSFPEVSVTQNNVTKVGVVGRLQPEKNLGAVVDIASHFRAENYQFNIVGEGPEGTFLEQKVSKVDGVQLLGQRTQSELYNFFQQTDIYIQPSLSEGLCITVLEAMASGLPVVASPVGGISKSVVDGETGYLIKPGNIEEYAKKIKKLSFDSELRRKMGKAGAKRVRNHYSHDLLAAKFTKLAMNLLSEAN
ncbi:glycosyltransferase family 4 protein [Salinirussus salinus]|uniref:glycosyltransferase family 4 protein n=1 Tax=Salinirussus salinus TaxID=1198300 RepID=UPI00135CAE3A|nr:glycosyltransferase family 4 protein [Salinirussus salinus]